MRHQPISYCRLLAAIGCTLLAIGLTACSDEETLTPNETSTGITYAFPEGTDSWDNDLAELATKFGTRCIYKHFTLSDLSRTWVATGSVSEYIGQPITDERLASLYVKFLKDNVFRFLSPEACKGVLPAYIFLAYDYCSVNYRPLGDGDTLVWNGTPKANYNGLGFWTFCFATDPHPNIMGTTWQQAMFTSATDVQKNREIILKNIFNLMVTKGAIAVPKEFAEGNGIDYTTPIVYGAANIANDNYYKRRGFPEQMRNLVSYVTRPTDLYSIVSTSPTQNFIDYLWLAFRYTPETVHANYADFPLVTELYDLTVSYVRDNYGMDITQIAAQAEPLE